MYCKYKDIINSMKQLVNKYIASPKNTSYLSYEYIFYNHFTYLNLFIINDRINTKNNFNIIITYKSIKEP